MVQMLVVVAAIGGVVGAALPVFRGAALSSEEAKLESSLAVLNSAVGVYRAQGGVLPADATGRDVVARLQSEVVSGMAKRQVGLSGTLVDPRWDPEWVAAGELPAGRPRLAWDGASARFAMTREAVAGIASFAVLEGQGSGVSEDSDRESAMLFAGDPGWVWDYRDRARAPLEGPLHATGRGETPVSSWTPPLTAGVLRLHEPLYSLDGGLYAEEDFDLELHFTDPNPAGVSEVWYSVDGAPFAPYTGDAVVISDAAEVQAFARSLDPDSWVDSLTADESYRQDILYFSGHAAGRFANPVGDDDMLVSIENSDTAAEMWWGAPYEEEGWFDGNYLRFEGTGFADVRAGQEFELGALTYFNSTTYLGTNATGVDLELMLQILVPDVAAAFNYGFELFSTPNSTENTADQNADFVWVGEADGSFAAEIRGYDYTLELRFGELAEDAEGFTAIDTFHVHEGSWATGSVFGTLVRGGRTDSWTGGPLPVDNDLDLGMSRHLDP